MKIFPEPADKPLAPVKLSTIPLEPVSAPLSGSRIFINSKPNSPLLLTILSVGSNTKQIFSFSAGEAIRNQIEKTKIKELLPSISKFELSEGQAEVSYIVPVEQPQVHQCRICLETDQQGDLISPCLCKGFQEFVHQGCLKVWMLRSEKNEKELTYCEVCRGKFKMTFTLANVCDLCGQGSFKFWIPMVMLLISFSSLLFFYFREDAFSGVSLESRIFVYCFLGFLSSLALIAMIAFRKTLYTGNKVIEWEILNYN